MHIRWKGTAHALLLIVTAATPASLILSQTTPPVQRNDGVPAQPEQHQGTVLIQSHGEAPTADQTTGPAKEAPQDATPDITDAERSALRITAYDLDARITPATAHLAMRARITARNDADHPLAHIVLQISSTLQWQSATMLNDGKRTTLTVAQHLLDTDADHTGKASELILTLPAPLAPQASLTLDTFYEGAITQNADRLDRIGAPDNEARASDWDAISAHQTLLRGFGNVLWYPVAAPQLFLGEGNELFAAIGAARYAGETITTHLHLAVEYHGEPPTAAYFCGLRQPLKALSDDVNAPVAEGSGIATADFPGQLLGFRVPTLFLIDHPEEMAAPLPAYEPVLKPSSSAPTTASELTASETQKIGSSRPEAQSAVVERPAAPRNTAGPPMLAIETTDGAIPLLAQSAETIAPLLQQWFGERPLSALTVIDHDGQPFEDGPLTLAPIAVLGASDTSPALAHSLTHAWVQTGQPWMDEGLAEFASLLWIEHERGRDAAITQLNTLVQPLPLVEPVINPPTSQSNSTNVGAPGPDSRTRDDAAQLSAVQPQPLISARDEIFYRRKAAAVWWQLRDIVGEEALQQALHTWRVLPVSHDTAASQALAFEKLLEQTSGKDLAWFFHDWVLNDVGLPDLTITDITPRALPAGAGHDAGWIVAVTVRNDGPAVADVPLVIRAGTFSATRRLRIPGFTTVTDRAIVESAPTEVLLNDGSVPEVRSSLHVSTVNAHTDPISPLGPNH